MLSSPLVYKTAARSHLDRLSFRYQHTYVHPCTINNQACVVYPFGLQKNSPILFSQLKKYFTKKGYILKEEQRLNEKNTNRNLERRKWLPILLFTAAMFMEPDLSASEIVQKQNDNTYDAIKHSIELNLIPPQQIIIVNNIAIEKKQPRLKIQSLKSTTAIIIYNILNEHYVKQSSDPGYIQTDLLEMANYYSRYPKVISLITSLKSKEWILKYNESIWSTVAEGSALQVDSATINFNTRSAAKLKLQNSCKDNPVCIASPADALLHELLHTHSMLLNTNEFIAQGGMNRFRYPMKHEYAVIKLERKLYSDMSNQDGTLRPQRNEHSGRKIIASCVTCIK